VTTDGEKVTLQINAGLLADMPHVKESGSDGIGLFRTELMFMLSHSLPRVDRQTQAYEAILNEAAGKPVVFRSLDIGGDKILPYLGHVPEENPAIGWRAIRMSLDRPALFRMQVRALLRAAAGRELRLMIPMVSTALEMDQIRVLIDKEREIAEKRGTPAPSKLLIGAMIEVPSVLFELDELLSRVDFVSVGSNDLVQFLFAADRSNSRVANRFDSLSVSPLRALKALATACRKHNVPLTLCGEMAGRPLEAMCLIGLGFRTLSMAPASIGPVKAMIRSLHANDMRIHLDSLLAGRSGSVRGELEQFAADHGIEL
jgi:phosphotransferase system enzyme I (PtsP)